MRSQLYIPTLTITCVRQGYTSSYGDGGGGGGGDLNLGWLLLVADEHHAFTLDPLELSRLEIEQDYHAVRFGISVSLTVLV